MELEVGYLGITGRDLIIKFTVDFEDAILEIKRRARSTTGSTEDRKGEKCRIGFTEEECTRGVYSIAVSYTNDNGTRS